MINCIYVDIGCWCAIAFLVRRREHFLRRGEIEVAVRVVRSRCFVARERREKGQGGV